MTAIVPSEGLEHPVFQGLGPDDHLIVVGIFAGDPGDEAVTSVETIAREWAAKAKRPGGDEVLVDEPLVTGRGFRLRVGNLAHPKRDVAALVADLGKAAPLKECFFACWSKVEGEEVMFPRVDPRAPLPASGDTGPAELAAAALSPKKGRASPPSEIFSQLRGAFEREGGDLILEDRGAAVHRPGLRIVYGLAPMEDVASDARTAEIKAALHRAIAERFEGLDDAVPQPNDKKARKGEIDAFRFGDRRGYGFAIAANDLLVLYSHEYCRYRESELFDALERVVRETGLAPVIMWRRMATPVPMTPLSKPSIYVIQLWEAVRRAPAEDRKKRSGKSSRR
jgi:hypothetical protein